MTSISTTFLKIFKIEIDQLWVHYQKPGLHFSDSDYTQGDSVEVDLKEI